MWFAILCPIDTIQGRHLLGLLFNLSFNPQTICRSHTPYMCCSAIYFQCGKIHCKIYIKPSLVYALRTRDPIYSQHTHIQSVIWVHTRILNEPISKYQSSTSQFAPAGCTEFLGCDDAVIACAPKILYEYTVLLSKCYRKWNIMNMYSSGMVTRPPPFGNWH